MKVLRRPLTLNAPSRGVPLAALVERRLADAGREQRQRRVLAAVQRQLAHLLAGDHLAALAGVGLDQRRRRGDLDLLGDLADRHLQVDAQARRHLHLDVVHQRDREAGLLRGDEVDARPDGDELVVAVARSWCAPPRRRSAVLVSVTLASGTVAPEASFTVPTTEAVSNCAEARGIPALSTKSRTSRLTRRRKQRM